MIIDDEADNATIDVNNNITKPSTYIKLNSRAVFYTPVNILEKAKIKSDEFIVDAKSKIEIEKQRAIKEIKEEVVDLSIDLASKILQRNVKDDDNEKFIKSSLEAMNVDEAKS